MHFAAWISHLDISGWIFDLSNVFSLLFRLSKSWGGKINWYSLEIRLNIMQSIGVMG